VNILKKFDRELIVVKKNCRVKQVNKDSVSVNDKSSNSSYDIPFGMCVWSTGIKQVPLVTELVKILGKDNQSNRLGLVVDSYLKVKGTENIYAIGDCAIVEPLKLKKEFINLFEKADINKDGTLTKEELFQFIKSFVIEYPQLEIYSEKMEKYFDVFDLDKSGSISQEEFGKLLESADNNIKSFPSTAQVAAQQGTYLGIALSNIAKGNKVDKFKYKHLGSFAYIGEFQAVGEVPGMLKGGGMAVWWIWRAVYLFKQVSFRNMCLVSFDWMKAFVFGRDSSRF